MNLSFIPIQTSSIPNPLYPLSLPKTPLCNSQLTVTIGKAFVLTSSLITLCPSKCLCFFFFSICLTLCIIHQEIYSIGERQTNLQANVWASSIESNQSKEQKEKIMKKNEQQILRDLWETIKHAKICTMAVPEEE